MTGVLEVLNVGDGDTKLTFDNSNPVEAARTSRIVADMLRRGYILFVEIGKDDKDRPKYQRVREFDESKAEYIIADLDPQSASAKDTDDDPVQSQEEAATPAATEPAGQKGKRRTTTRRIKASEAKAVSVGRTAGG